VRISTQVTIATAKARGTVAYSITLHWQPIYDLAAGITTSGINGR
jgi:hypothetical protein